MLFKSGNPAYVGANVSKFEFSIFTTTLVTVTLSGKNLAASTYMSTPIPLIIYLKI